MTRIKFGFDKTNRKSSLLFLFQEGRRTLYKAYGIKFVIIVQGIAGRQILKSINNYAMLFNHCVKATICEGSLTEITGD